MWPVRAWAVRKDARLHKGHMCACAATLPSPGLSLGSTSPPTSPSASPSPLCSEPSSDPSPSSDSSLRSGARRTSCFNDSGHNATSIFVLLTSVVGGLASKAPGSAGRGCVCVAWRGSRAEGLFFSCRCLSRFLILLCLPSSRRFRIPSSLALKNVL